MTQTLEFKPTIMQKLLGRNYKWWYLMLFNYRASSAYFWSDLFYYFNYVVTSVISIWIWNLSNRNDINETVNYLLFGNIFYNLTLFNNNWRLSGEIFDGKIASRLILPTNINLFYFFNTIAYAFKQNAIILIYLPLIIFFQDTLEFKLYNVPYLILLIPIVIGIKFSFNQLVAATAFWFKNAYGAISLSETAMALFSGSLIPLFIFNNNLITLTPFAWLLHHPMQIYLGKYDTNQTLLVFLGGITWCVVLYFLAKLVFKLGLKRNESVGL